MISKKKSHEYLSVRKYDEDQNLSASDAFDIILNDVKPAGKWQLVVFFITSFSGFFISMQNMASALISPTPDFWCNVTGVHEVLTVPDVRQDLSLLPKCDYYEGMDGEPLFPFVNATYPMSNLTRKECDVWIYDTSIYMSSTVSEWDLVCDNKWMNSAAQSIYMAGVLAGGVILSEMADTYGRRTIVLFSTVFFIVCSITSAFSLSYPAFVILRFLSAFSAFGVFIPNFVILMEVLGADARAWLGILYQALFGVGICVFAGIGYLIRDWRSLQITIAAPASILLFYFIWLPESPRWLLSQGKEKEAIDILKRMSEMNGGRLPDDKNMDYLISKIVGEQPKKYNVFQIILRFFKNQTKLLRTPIIRRRSIIMFFAWFVVSMVYYGLAFSAPNINTSVYLLVFLSGASEAIAVLLSSWSILRFGRKLNLCTSFFIAGISCLLILAVPKELVWINVTLAIIGKFFTSVAFAVGYIFSAELVPTEMRNISVGTCSMYARFGSILAPFIVDLLGAVHYTIPSTVFGVFSILAGGFTLLLPETDHQKLPETIEEIELMER